MPVLSLDWESKSTVDLRKAGVYVYAKHADTDLWVGAWAFDDEEPDIWTPGMPVPERIVEHVNAGGEVRSWNVAFERLMWREIATPRYGWPVARLEQFVCSAAEAAAMALPRSLDQAAQVLGVQQQKDSEGYNLMLRMARPRKVHDDGRVEWWDVPDRKARLFEYCKQDVRTERAVEKCLRRLTPTEREVYLLDQRVNDRGIGVDRALVVAAKDVAAEGVQRANATIAALTGGSVTEVTNHGRLLGWLRGQGVEADSVAKPAVKELLDGELTPAVRAVLEARSDAGRSSIAKLDSLLACACPDDRLRGLLLYHGASTGRWTGRLVQPHNFPRGEVDDVESFIEDVLARDYDRIDLFAHPVVVISSLLRSMLVARRGHDLIAADFSAIEARVLNWLAGQADMVRLFQQYDAAPKGEKEQYDPYRHNAAKLYKIPLAEVKKFPHRQTGKFQELGCGYGMGAKKAVSAGKAVYGLTLDEAQAKEIVDGYRATHDRVVDFWYDTERACIAAIENPGQVQVFGQRYLKAVKAGAYLYVVLPSGRPLCYAAPRVVLADMPWCDVCGKRGDAHGPVVVQGHSGEGSYTLPGPDHQFTPAKKPQMEYSGVDSYTRQWGRLRAYGGLLVENIVQAVSRDLLAEGMLRAEAAGYLPVLSVHDEAVAEVPEGFGSVAEFERLLAETPEWAKGCPVAAEGWRGYRYRK